MTARVLPLGGAAKVVQRRILHKLGHGRPQAPQSSAKETDAMKLGLRPEWKRNAIGGLVQVGMCLQAYGFGGLFIAFHLGHPPTIWQIGCALIGSVMALSGFVWLDRITASVIKEAQANVKEYVAKTEGLERDVMGALDGMIGILKEMKR